MKAGMGETTGVVLDYAVDARALLDQVQISVARIGGGAGGQAPDAANMLGANGVIATEAAATQQKLSALGNDLVGLQSQLAAARAELAQAKAALAHAPPAQQGQPAPPGAAPGTYVKSQAAIGIGVAGLLLGGLGGFFAGQHMAKGSKAPSKALTARPARANPLEEEEEEEES